MTDPTNVETGAQPVADEATERRAKRDLLRSKDITPYASTYDRSHTIGEARELPLETSVRVAGRVVRMRTMGKVTFADLTDASGKIQLVLRVGELDDAAYGLLTDVLSIGDFLGVDGTLFTTQKGELSILVRGYTILTKALQPLPEKWHGLRDVETCYRKRYLDLIANEDTRARFLFRSHFIAALRAFYAREGFIELETPVLGNSASGALAKPFITHYNALDLDVYLRIAPEIHLKEAIIGGFEKVFEFARVFRNEGMDASHLQEFTMLEHYAAYWDYRANMTFTERMLSTIVQDLLGTTRIQTLNRADELVDVDLTPPWRVISFRELVHADCGIDIDEHPTADLLRAAVTAQGIDLGDTSALGRGNLIDTLYKKVSRPKLVDPVFLTEHPIDLSPLARRNDENPVVADRFQLVVNGWELVNAYSELIDPDDQRERFAQQQQARAHGDEDAMRKDDTFVEALEHGMPPTSGWGMGIDRVVALLTQQQNLRDVVLFPLLRPHGD